MSYTFTIKFKFNNYVELLNNETTFNGNDSTDITLSSNEVFVLTSEQTNNNFSTCLYLTYINSDNTTEQTINLNDSYNIDSDGYYKIILSPNTTTDTDGNETVTNYPTSVSLNVIGSFVYNNVSIINNTSSNKVFTLTAPETAEEGINFNISIDFENKYYNFNNSVAIETDYTDIDTTNYLTRTFNTKSTLETSDGLLVIYNSDTIPSTFLENIISDDTTTTNDLYCIQTASNGTITNYNNLEFETFYIDTNVLLINYGTITTTTLTNNGYIYNYGSLSYSSGTVDENMIKNLNTSNIVMLPSIGSTNNLNKNLQTIFNAIKQEKTASLTNSTTSTNSTNNNTYITKYNLLNTDMSVITDMTNTDGDTSYNIYGPLSVNVISGSTAIKCVFYTIVNNEQYKLYRMTKTINSTTTEYIIYSYENSEDVENNITSAQRCEELINNNCLNLIYYQDNIYVNRLKIKILNNTDSDTIILTTDSGYTVNNVYTLKDIENVYLVY